MASTFFVSIDIDLTFTYVTGNNDIFWVRPGVLLTGTFLGQMIDSTNTNGTRVTVDGSVYSHYLTAFRLIGTSNTVTIGATGVMSAGDQPSVLGPSATIEMRGFAATVNNFGTILGTVKDFNQDYSVIRLGSDKGHISNYGVISAEGQAIVIEGVGGSSSRIENYGTIFSRASAITVTGGNATVINQGIITGNIVFGIGDDVFNGRGGTVIGFVQGNGGGDTYITSDPTLEIRELAVDSGTDRVLSTVSYTLTANSAIEELTLIGSAIAGHGNELANSVTGNAEDNLLSGGSGNDSLTGNEGYDRLLGGAGDDLMYGGDDGDTLEGGLGADLAFGGDGDDVLRGRVSSDRLFGGNDDDVLAGGLNNDSLNGIEGADSLLGGQGNDSLNGGDGADTLNGGFGVDAIYFDFSVAGVSVNLATGAASGGDADGDVIVLGTIENIVGSGLNDTLVGDAKANQIIGGSGNDSVNGGLGNDTMLGGAGADRFDGGGGVDTLTYVASLAPVTVNLATLVGLSGDALGDTYVANSISVVLGSLYGDSIFGGTGNEQFFGNSGDDSLFGGNGNDSLSGDLGSDLLTGGSGNDVLIFTGGNDTFTGGLDIDTVSFANSFVGVNVNLLASGWSIVAGADTGGITEVEVVIGSSSADSITANGLGVSIAGGAGGDTMVAGASVDTFVFTTLSDSAAVPGGSDQINLFNAFGGDIIDLRGVDAITGGADNAFALFLTDFGVNQGIAGNLVLQGTTFLNGRTYALMVGYVDAGNTIDFQIAVDVTTSDLTAANFIL